jgi:hypothetical protein
MHDKLIGRFFSSEKTATVRSYVDMLELYALLQLPPQTILKQCGAQPHFGHHISYYLGIEIAGRWIGQLLGLIGSQI